MRWFARFRDAPLYFQAVVGLMLVDILFSFFIYVPGMWERGLATYGNLSWAPLLAMSFLVVADAAAAAKILRTFAVVLAAITTAWTLSRYGLCLSAHAENPNNPSFFFTWANWLDGAVFPWVVAASWLLTPAEKLPLRQRKEAPKPTSD